jgi:hypothetical protein
MVTNAATTDALPFHYTLAHDEANQRVTIDSTQPVPEVTYVYPGSLGAVSTVTEVSTCCSAGLLRAVMSS